MSARYINPMCKHQPFLWLVLWLANSTPGSASCSIYRAAPAHFHVISAEVKGAPTFQENEPGTNAEAFQALSEHLVGAAAGDAALAIPPANPCGSAYDTFYAAEAGVYAYWPLCELGSTAALYDIVGRYDWSTKAGGWSSGGYSIQAVQPGPVPDGEGGQQVSTQASFSANQDIVVNSRAGTIAVWAKADADRSFGAIFGLQAVEGRSSLSVGVVRPTSSTGVCFQGVWINSAGLKQATPQACGYGVNAWHRVVLTWSAGVLNLYVDGTSRSQAIYKGSLDNKVFLYRLFPQGADNQRRMAAAKVVLSNRYWNAGQVAGDFAPMLVHPPKGGVYVTSERLGTVHRDVLGYADQQALLSDTGTRKALFAGLHTAGVAAVRYANGANGIDADLTNWQGGATGAACTATRGVVQAALNASSLDTTETYIPEAMSSLHASLGYVVNYGTNPPLCNAGGDPVRNGGELVAFLNQKKRYGFKYLEIGNELYNGGGSETDLHPYPGDGTSYASFESGYYRAMRAVDPAIRIGIPVGMNRVYSWLSRWTLPAMAMAEYDSVVYHNYPTVDPITDAAVLYPERVASNTGPSKGDLLSLQTLLFNQGRDPEAIWVTEWNDNANGGGPWSRQALGGAAPLFAAMWLAEYMNAGVQYATWFAQYGSGMGCNPYNYDARSEDAYSAVNHCGGSFLVYPGPDPNEMPVGFKAGDLSPVGHTFQLFSQSGLVQEGEHMLRTATDSVQAPWLLAYAATHGAGYALVLINRDRDTAHVIPVQLAGKTVGSSVQQWTYGRAQYDLAFRGNWSAGPVHSTLGAWSGTVSVAMPPWSVNVLVLE